MTIEKMTMTTEEFSEKTAQLLKEIAEMSAATSLVIDRIEATVYA